jgi:hypothetical protein
MWTHSSGTFQGHFFLALIRSLNTSLNTSLNMLYWHGGKRVSKVVSAYNVALVAIGMGLDGREDNAQRQLVAMLPPQ